ncbi:ethanolamine utilization protein EutH [Clostridium sp. SHJSY1]|uniref:ethanolamine utilization protein EutH n=1 Tax=Clostridium sp. SHJSY1 TaxID=2942483 RepID=UPI002876E051|nr:ethanolamine utilization protein EutH [Clostridium sp. SHJSY1]MDS0528117.1 ethanolamine utilization protein EutH [Clostridium sp. SHJSY1]
MGNILLYIVTFFFVLGAVDYFLENRFNLGKYFEDGIKTMGSLALSMIGILSITPLLIKGLEKILVPFSKSVGLDPSIFTSSFIAVDMGAYNMAINLSESDGFIKFSGILMASILGCTLSFTIPFALGVIKKEFIGALSKGIVCGIITMPIGLLIGGLLLKINIWVMLLNLTPVIILSILLSLGIMYKPDICIKLFGILGKVILFISICGLIIQGIYSISSVELLKDIMPLKDTILIVGKIALFLGGAYVMLEFLQRSFKIQLEWIGKKINISGQDTTILMGALASAIIVFSSFDKLDYKGKVICSAFSVAGAYVFGGQLGYVVSVEPSIINIYIFTKLISGILAVLLAVFILRKEERINME